MTKLVALAGRKQSGKSTTAKFLTAAGLTCVGILKAFRFLENGELEVSTTLSGEEEIGTFDPTLDQTQEVLRTVFLEDLNLYADQLVKVYSFADVLKRDVCMKVLGLTYEQCYGTEEHKNSLTHLKWEDMPTIIWAQDKKTGVNINDPVSMIMNELPEFRSEGHNYIQGSMTAREVMQYVGTKIFRKMYPDVWVDALVRQIKEKNTELGVIADCRFPNEVKRIQELGGKVIRLLRNPHDDHDASETALDNYEGFDLVIDNSNLTIKETNRKVEEFLRGIGWFPNYGLGAHANDVS